MKYSYFVTSDSTCDLPQNYYEDEMAVIPMNYIVNGEFFDGTPQNSLTPQQFYARLRKGETSSTSLINTHTAIDFFTPILEKGYDILHLTLASALTSSFKCMLEARDILKEKFPDRKLIIIDSRGATLGQGFLVVKVLKKRAEGATIDEAADFALNLRDKCRHDFTVDDLMHLYRGGRLSKSSAVIGSALKVKPLLIVNPEGALVATGKAIGRKPALRALVDKMVEKTEGIDNSDLVFIGHGDCIEDAQFVADKIKERFGYQNIVIGDVGPVIGSHTGAGIVALFYLGKDKEK